jgi:hypothetical protein
MSYDEEEHYSQLPFFFENILEIIVHQDNNMVDHHIVVVDSLDLPSAEVELIYMIVIIAIK